MALQSTKPKTFSIYKPNKKKTGSACQFSIKRIASDNAIECGFLELANQIEEKSFDWDNKITVKLGINDISEILGLLHSAPFYRSYMKHGSSVYKANGIKLFHQSNKGNTTISLSEQENPDYLGYYLIVSRKLDGETAPFRVSIPISLSEAYALRTLLERMVVLLYNW